MSALVLSKKQQMKTLSALKKGKKTKNVLTTPGSLKISNPVVDEERIKEVISVLESLLPTAKLPGTKSSKRKSNSEKVILNKGAVLKRNQLLLGVNVVSKAVSNGTVACIIFADDIQPKLLISHLVVLCSLKKIPYIFLPDFRALTMRALGFPCIVLGFKKDYTDFLPAIKIITSIPKDGNNTSDVESDRSADDSVDEDKWIPLIKYKYLSRDNSSTRVFVPNNMPQNQADSNDIILLRSDEIENEVEQNETKFQGITKRKFSDEESLQEENESLDNQMSEFLVSKKRRKMKQKHQFQKERSSKVSVNYSVSEVVKIRPNANREKKKFQKLKKKKKKNINVSS